MVNARRRAVLVDAAIDVLAAQGARGLTFRAVDLQAGVPTGTSTNYFASRDDLLTQAGGRVYQRLAPDPPTLAASLGGVRDQDRVVELVRELTRRMEADRTGYLALLELRLEATRRPALRTVLAATVRADLEASLSYYVDSGLPGDRTTAVLLYLAVSWLVVEQLTLPSVLPDATGQTVEQVVALVVRRLVPPG